MAGNGLTTHTLAFGVELPRDAFGWNLIIKVMLFGEIECIKQLGQCNQRFKLSESMCASEKYVTLSGSKYAKASWKQNHQK